MAIDESLSSQICSDVTRALDEDIGAGDLTAQLVPDNEVIVATVIARESMIQAGSPWFDEVTRQIDSRIDVRWFCRDGDAIEADTPLCQLRGPARSILTAERTAINFLQTLSATATVTSKYVAAVASSGCRILDTRKTIPGLRLAQKYAVKCGGGVNHRIGLFDSILIKENHILSVGGLDTAIRMARELHPDAPIEVEVESIEEFRRALQIGVDRILLDNFSIDLLRAAVEINRVEGDPPAKLEASGGIGIECVKSIADTGVDFVSVGALTKNIRAVDLSMRFEQSVTCVSGPNQV